MGKSTQISRQPGFASKASCRGHPDVRRMLTSSLRAVFNKGAHGVVETTRAVEAALPFPIEGFDCDNGSEFLNWHLVRYFQQRAKVVKFTRSRPYHKNDNGHVEQKN